MASVGDIEDLKPCKKSEVVSISRRTDIPAFYMKSFVVHMIQGYIDVPNPRNPSQVSRISLKPTEVKCMSWWSKNYGPWIKAYLKNKVLFDSYPSHIFNFTINSESELETGVKISVQERLAQLSFLVEHFGSESIKYRFDPITHYHRIGSKQIINNLDQFEEIVSTISGMGVKQVIFAFAIPFPKSVRRMKERGKILVTLTDSQKKIVLDELLEIASKYGVTMASCSNNSLVGYNNIVPSSCIDSQVIDSILKEKGLPCLKSKRKDSGQRDECNCVVSRDVGSYEQKCQHSCDYCYANPT